MRAWLAMWSDLLSLHFLGGPDGRLSFTKLAALAIVAYGLWRVPAALSWIYLAFIVVFASIPFGRWGLALIIGAYTKQPPPASPNDEKEGA